MGSPLSPVLSNIFMEFLEARHLAEINEIKFWVRYVDDIFALIPQDVNIDSVLLKLNILNKSIKFTLEKEDNNKLPFLDVEILRVNNRACFRVYRKPTNSDSYVHWLSGHHKKIKSSACLSAYLRAFRICSPEFLDKEINTIFTCYKKLGYPKKFLKYNMKKAKKIFYTQSKKEFKRENIIILPFNPSTTTIKFIPKEINIVTNYNNKIKNFAFTPHNTGQNSACVYSIPCLDCDKVYIGETDNLDRRLYQHIHSLNLDDMNSALTQHRWRLNHRINPRGANKLLSIKAVDERKIAENFYISNISNFNTRIEKNNILVDEIFKNLKVFRLNN
jgi:hypothetical protein